MEPRADGRMYSRITRRTVAIIKQISPGRQFTIKEIADEVHSSKLPEFYLERFKRQMSTSRTRDYVRYLRHLDLIKEQENKYVLQFAHRQTDQEWAQALSDAALLHLARILDKDPVQIPDLLTKYINKFFKQRRVTTVDAIVADIGIESESKQELFKWSLFMFTDGEKAAFDIRRFPILMVSRS